MKIDDLEFYVMIKASGHVRGEPLKLEKFNIFNSTKVKHSVAMWVIGEAPDNTDFLRWCFGDLDGSCEYEMMMSAWPTEEENCSENCSVKCSVFKLYVEPNEKLLRNMVNKVSISSAKTWLNNNNKRKRR